jgi:hypothetical protein
MCVQQRHDHAFIAEKNELDVRASLEESRRPRDHHGRAMIAPHGVQRDAYELGHE